MSNLKSLIRKLKMIPKTCNIYNPLYREILDCYHGNDYLDLCRKLKKENLDDSKNVNRYFICDNSENNNYDWSLSISILLPNQTFHSLDDSHLKLLNGKLKCDSQKIKFKLINGSVSINNNHNLVNISDKEAIFLTIHQNNIFRLPLL